MYEIDVNKTLKHLVQRLGECVDAIDGCSELSELVKHTERLKDLTYEWVAINDILDNTNPIIFIQILNVNKMFKDAAKIASLQSMKLYLEGLEG